jgi:hypothetical protein
MLSVASRHPHHGQRLSIREIRWAPDPAKPDAHIYDFMHLVKIPILDSSLSVLPITIIKKMGKPKNRANWA